MKRILLTCYGGFSTSMLVRRMEEYAQANNIEVSIQAVPEDQVSSCDMDVVLLGPQIAHRLEILKESLTVPVEVIDSYDYGTMNGEKVLKKALEMLGERNEH